MTCFAWFFPFCNFFCRWGNLVACKPCRELAERADGCRNASDTQQDRWPCRGNRLGHCDVHLGQELDLCHDGRCRDTVALGSHLVSGVLRESDRVGHMARQPAIPAVASSGARLAVIAGPTRADHRGDLVANAATYLNGQPEEAGIITLPEPPLLLPDFSVVFS